METTHNLVKVRVGIKVKKLVVSLIGWEVAVDHGSFNILERETLYC